jgi:hypothetical protein
MFCGAAGEALSPAEHPFNNLSALRASNWTSHFESLKFDKVSPLPSSRMIESRQPMESARAGAFSMSRGKGLDFLRELRQTAQTPVLIFGDGFRTIVPLADDDSFDALIGKSQSAKIRGNHRS